ncbi:MAG: hypothetical protein ACLQU3_02200 [Limisphaerales bacterium]
MRSWRSSVLEDCDAGKVRPVAQMPMVRPGLLYLVTAHDVQELRGVLAQGRLPADLEAKLARLAGGSLSERYVEHNSRLFVALLLAALQNSFTRATPADRERLLRVLAYVRKDDDAVPDYQPGGFIDDQQEVRAVATELNPVLLDFKIWRLRHQVPGMWRC